MDTIQGSHSLDLETSQKLLVNLATVEEEPDEDMPNLSDSDEDDIEQNLRSVT